MLECISFRFVKMMQKVYVMIPQEIENAQEYINNNCKYCIRYFKRRNINKVMLFAAKILVRKLLDMNKFVSYFYHSLCYMYDDYNYYCILPKSERKDLYDYQIVVIKILMHINAIFTELENIEKRNTRKKK